MSRGGPSGEVLGDEFGPDLVEESADGRGQWDAMPVEDQEPVVPVSDEVFGSELDDARDRQAVEQNEGADAADVERQIGVVHASLELRPALFLGDRQVGVRTR